MDNFTGPLFAGKDLNGLDSGFRQKLEEITKAFRDYVIQEKRKNWDPLLISSTRRSDSEQLEAMINLIPAKGGLTKVYGTINIGPLMPIIDDSIVSDRIHHSYENTLKDYERQNDKEVVAFLKDIADMEKSKYERKEGVRQLLNHLIKNSRYGYISSHRTGKAVDVSGRYALISDLGDFFREKGNYGLKIKGDYDDGHLHLGF